MKEIRLPQFGMGMTEGLIAKWHKSVGDPVKEGELLCDIEAAKTTIELQAPCSGTLAAILIAADQSVPVNTCIALVGVPGEDFSASARDAAPRAEAIVSAAASAPKLAVQVEPRARHIARAHHVDLAKLRGSGPGGRITEEDVLAVLAASGVR
jgi:pyruvate dehydrogenase E2 component (dihydrolipoamide acetyltransferase)